MHLPSSMLRPLATVLLLTIAASAATAQSPQGSTGEALAVRVAETERAFARTMAERDHAAFVSFLSEEAVFFGGSAALRGSDAVAAGWRPFFDGPDAPFSWEPETVEVLQSGTLALSTGPVRDRSGRVTGTFTSIWRLEAPDTWRIVFDKGCPAVSGNSGSE
jgi:ketosteroid isomerase-like protein